MATTTWTQDAGMTSPTEADNVENYSEAAEASKDAAAASATAAAGSAASASGSETTASTKATESAASATASNVSAALAMTLSTAAGASKVAAETAETNAETAETNAETAQTAAEAAQTAAEAAETGAETAETNAETSKTNAAASATAAATSATSASGSATSASTQATNAATSATQAAGSAIAAAAAQTAAETAETNAASSASAASTSETNAASSATSASTDASTATTKASEASASEVAAEAAKVAAEAALDEFTDIYLGAKSSDPTLDNDGNALSIGDQYFNTVSSILKIYNGSSWQAAALDSSGFVASTGDTMTGDLDVGGTVTADGLTVGIGDNIGVNAGNGFAIDASSNIDFTSGGVKSLRIKEGDISFYEDTGTTAKFFWDASAESLGIGNTSPQGKLEVSGDVYINGGSKSTDAALVIQAGASGTDGVTLDTSYYGGGYGPLKLKTGGTEAMRIRSDGTIRFGSGSSSSAYVLGAAPNTYNSGWGSDTDDFSTWINYAGYQGGTTRYRDFIVGDGKNQRIATFDGSSGNVGIGVVPESWLSAYTALQIGDAGSVVGSTDNSFVALGANAYLDSTNSRYEYINSDFASQYYQVDGTHVWRTAASGTADAAITFDSAMTLDASGNLLVGKTSSAFATAGIELQADAEIVVTRNGSTASFNRLSDGNILDFYKSGAHAGSIGVSGTALLFENPNTNSYIAFHANNQSTGIFYQDGTTKNLAPYTARNNEFDLGNQNGRWKDLWLSNAVRLGDASLQEINGTDPFLSGNAYFNGSTWNYLTSTDATNYYQSGGQHVWRYAASGTADGTISWSPGMTLDSSGQLLVGHTDPFSPIANGGAGVTLTGGGQIFAGHAGPPLYVNREDSDGDIAVFRKDGSTVGSIGTTPNTIYIDGGSGDTGLQFGSSTIYPRDNGSTSDGGVDLGASSIRFKDLYLSGTIEIENGTGNVGVGKDALRITTGDYNTGIGRTAGNFLTGGDNNTFLGFAAGYESTGSRNTFVGARNGTLGSGQSMTTGSANTILGGFSGNQGGLDIRTSSNNIVLSDGDGNPRVYIDDDATSFFGTTTDDFSGLNPSVISVGPVTGQNGIKVHVSSAANYVAYGAKGSNNAYYFAYMSNPSNANIGSILCSVSSTSYNTSSDYRLKENVVYDWDATTRLKQLKPARFNFIVDADTTVDGFLAHEAQAVVPECATGTHNEVDDDGNAVMQGIDQSKLVPLLVKTIQELEARITALENA